VRPHLQKHIFKHSVHHGEQGKVPRGMDQKERNAVLKGGWDKDVRKWTVERDNAKYERHKPRWTKPKIPIMEKAIRKPMLADFSTEDSDSDEEDNNVITTFWTDYLHCVLQHCSIVVLMCSIYG